MTALLIATLLLFPTSAAAGGVQVDSTIIENGTLLIGTHLIYLQAATDRVCQIAQQSAIDAQQDQIYYKSEFAQGAWLNITKAQNIFQLSLQDGVVVENSLISSLELTHHTKPDGKTYQLDNGSPVNLSNLDSPSDTANLPELEGARMMRDALNASDKPSKAEKSKLALLNGILNGSYSNEETQALDREIDALNDYLNYLLSRKADKDELDAASALMTQQTNRRKALVYTLQKTVIEEAINTASAGNADRESLTDLVDLLSRAVVEMESAIQAAGANELAPGSSTKSKRYFVEATQLLQSAMDKEFEVADGNLAVLVDLGCIEQQQVTRRQRETELAASLRDELYIGFAGVLSMHSTPQLESALAQGGAPLLNAARQAALADGDTLRLELQEMVDAIVLRSAPEEQVTRLIWELEQANALLPRVSLGELRQAQQQSLQSYIDYLEKKRREAQNALGAKTQAGQQQQALQALEAQYLEALDANDLTKAAALSTEMDTLRQAQQSLSQQLNRQLADARAQKEQVQQALDKGEAGDVAELQGEQNALDAQIAKLEGELSQSDKNALDALDSLRDSALAQINSGVPDSSLLADIQGILLRGNQYPVESNRLLEELYTAANRRMGVGGTSGLSGTGADTGTGTGAQNLPNPPNTLKEAVKLLEDELGESRRNADAALRGGVDVAALEQRLLNAPLPIATAALSLLWQQTGDGGVEQLLVRYAQREGELVALGALPTDTLWADGRCYLPLESVAPLTGMRAVLRSNVYVLSSGARYYQFQAGSATVLQSQGEEQMSKAALLDAGQLFIPADYVKSRFALDNYPLPKGQALLLGIAEEKQVQQLYAAIKTV